MTWNHRKTNLWGQAISTNVLPNNSGGCCQLPSATALALERHPYL